MCYSKMIKTKLFCNQYSIRRVSKLWECCCLLLKQSKCKYNCKVRQFSLWPLRLGSRGNFIRLFLVKGLSRVVPSFNLISEVNRSDGSIWRMSLETMLWGCYGSLGSILKCSMIKKKRSSICFTLELKAS